MTVDGEPSLDAKRAEVAANPHDMRVRLDFARMLTAAELFEEATDAHVWFWDHALEHWPAMRGVRRSYFIRDLEKLISRHDPARAAVTRLRDQVTPPPDREPDLEAFSDWACLNRALGRDHETLQWFDEVYKTLPSSGRLARVLEIQVMPLLLAEGRLAEGGALFSDPLATWPAPRTPAWISSDTCGSNSRMMTELSSASSARSSFARPLNISSVRSMRRVGLPTCARWWMKHDDSIRRKRCRQRSQAYSPDGSRSKPGFRSASKRAARASTCDNWPMRGFRTFLISAVLATTAVAFADANKQIAAEFALNKAKVEAGKAFEQLRAADKLAEQAQNDWTAATTDVQKVLGEQAAATKNAKLAAAQKAAAAATQTIIDIDLVRAKADKKYGVADDATRTAAEKRGALDEAAGKARTAKKLTADAKALADLATAGKDIADAEVKLAAVDAALEKVADAIEKAEVLLGKAIVDLDNLKATPKETAAAVTELETAERDLMKAAVDELAQLRVRAKAEHEVAAASGRVATAMRAIAVAEHDSDVAAAAKAAGEAATMAATADAASADAADEVVTATEKENAVYDKAVAPYVALAKADAAAIKDRTATSSPALVAAFAGKDKAASELRKALADRAKGSAAVAAAAGARAKALAQLQAASADH